MKTTDTEPKASASQNRGLFDETSTEKAVNWSKAFCPVCQPIVDGHFRKRERAMQAELARLQTELDKATGNTAKTDEPNKPQAQHSPREETQYERDTRSLEELCKRRDELRNHAEKLAEALKPFAYAFTRGDVHPDAELFTIGKWSVYGRDLQQASAALAQWEQSQ